MASYSYIQSSGVIIPDVSDLRTDVEDEYKDVFGQDFVVDPETPEGVLIDAEVSSRESLAQNNAELANQINPNQAGGVFLDALWALTGGSRTPGTRSLVTCTLTGVPGTVILEGRRVKTNVADTKIFRLISAATIGVGGTVTAVLESEDIGPIPAASGTLTEIIDKVLGWDTITNASAATLGKAQESDADSRNRRRATLALHGRALIEAITSEVRNVANVRDAVGRENITNTTAIIDGLSVSAHSLRVVALGGIDADVAFALFKTKSGGCNWDGNTSVNITDTYSGQVYAVNFDRPTEQRVLVRYTIKASSVQASDPTVTLPEAAEEYASGLLEGEKGLVLGADISPFEFAGAAARRSPELVITKVEVAFWNGGSPVYDTVTLTTGLDEYGSVQASDVTVVQI